LAFFPPFKKTTQQKKPIIYTHSPVTERLLALLCCSFSEKYLRSIWLQREHLIGERA